MSVCTADNIKLSLDSCAYVKDFCGDQYKFLNFLEFYYCDINENVPLIVFISLLFILFIFNILGSTADRYLSPALEAVSDRLKLSEAIAGVTLVALANGATDVVAGLVAGSKGSDQGFPIAVGALFGACLFTVTCVLARCLQGSPTIKVDHASFIRDVSFLLLATVYFIFLTVINEITPILAAVYFMFYAGYFAIVIYQNRKKEKEGHSIHERLLESKREISKFGRSKTIEDIGTESLLGSYVVKKSIKRALTRGKSLGPMALDSKGGSRVFPEEDSPLRRSKAGSDPEAKKSKSSQGSEAEEEEDNSLFGRIMRYYEMPLNFVRDITMPPFDDERWNVYMAAVTPFLGLLFFLWQFGILDYFYGRWYLWIVYAVIAAPIAIWILVKGRDHNLGEEHAGKFAIATFILSGAWLSFIVTCFLDFLSLITIISGMPLNYLSLTMLAWGNSLDDFFVDYQICKSGHGPMAVTGVYAGQLFNLLVGFGGSMFLQTLKAPNNKIIPDIYKFAGSFGDYDFQTDLLTVVLLACVVVGLTLTMLVGLLSKWTLGRKMMIFVLTFYSAFFLTVTVLTFA